MLRSANSRLVADLIMSSYPRRCRGRQHSPFEHGLVGDRIELGLENPVNGAAPSRR